MDGTHVLHSLCSAQHEIEHRRVTIIGDVIVRTLFPRFMSDQLIVTSLALSVAIQSAIEKFPWYGPVELGLRLKLSLNATWSHLPYLIIQGATNCLQGIQLGASSSLSGRIGGW